MNPTKFCSILIISILLSGCIAKHTVKEHVYTCSAPNRFFTSEVDGKKTEFLFSPEITNEDEPIDAEVFWVRIVAFNKDRKYYYRNRDGYGMRWYDGAEAVPMLYSTEHAFIEADDGTVIKAAPGIYFADQRDHAKPGRWISTGMVNINSDEIQLSNKSGNSLYGRVYIKFDTKPPRPDAQWRLHLGRVNIKGESVALQPHDLCTRKGSSQWVYSTLRP